MPPSTVGTAMSAPSVASGNVTGTVIVRFLPSMPKSGVRLDAADDVEVAGRAAVAARAAAALEPDALAVGDACRDADLDLTGPALDARCRGSWARVLDDHARGPRTAGTGG